MPNTVSAQLGRHAPQPRKSYVVHAIVLAALLMGGYAGMTWKAQRDARVEAETARAALAEIHRQWVDAYQLAMSTPRVGLAGPVASLQALARRAEEVSVPACLEGPKSDLVAGARGAERVMRMFMSQVEDGALIDPRLQAQAKVASYVQGVAAAKCPA
jgi:hypothetical protein